MLGRRGRQPEPGRIGAGSDHCVFCSRHDQPQVLFETESLYAMPDKYPMLPGHTLIIARQHLACYAAASDALLAELDRAISHVRSFLDAAYDSPVLIFENGVAGQTVFHAHLHLVPVRILEISATLAAHEDIATSTGWKDVRAHYVLHGMYRYVQLHDRSYIIAGYSPVLHTMRRVMAETTDLSWSEHGWARATTPEDVRNLNRRWHEWIDRDDANAW